MSSVQGQMTRVWINRGAYAALVEEADRVYPNETGGILAGYRADNGDSVIHAVVGPGPSAMHSSWRFFPDHDWQCRELESLYADSAGHWVYIGDWHTHPNGVPQMSWLDRRTLRRIAKYPKAHVSQPMMLIGGGNPLRWDWKVHEYCGDQLFGVAISSRSHELTIFD